VLLEIRDEADHDLHHTSQFTQHAFPQTRLVPGCGISQHGSAIRGAVERAPPLLRLFNRKRSNASTMR
jgi:hypothetical protein